MQKLLQDISIRHFLLTNLHIPVKSKDGKNDKVRFIVPLHILSESILDLGSFPYQWDEAHGSVPTTWSGPTLAIKGTKSPWVSNPNYVTTLFLFLTVSLKIYQSEEHLIISCLLPKCPYWRVGCWALGWVWYLFLRNWADSWPTVHAERPTDFRKLVVDFLAQ